ncbi:hypothetical protein C7451_111107 [Blastomonas natatoria]|uniref:Uncharacterized protein n=1 Tax=Blastomonas natatoria TaxID=34015 RepID=A0A2V3UXZ6_9SPHN|nr:hypothetical protein [Blastomonas natatoria]PXW72985.1 hypothetical protein C7451_111107 [Blastomonas natatoria]
MKASLFALLSLVAFTASADPLSAREIPTFAFKPDSYVRLRVVVEAESQIDENVFDTKFCPDKFAFEMNLADLLAGDRTASLIVRVTAPNQASTPVELNIFDINRKNGGIFSGPSCKLGINQIDYKTPLHLGAQYRDMTMQVGLKLADAKGSAQLFADGLSGFLTIANAIAPLPAPLLRAENGLVTRVTEGLARKTDVSEAVDLNIGSKGKHSKTWTLSSSVRPGMPKLTIHAYLENVGSFFTMPGDKWDPALLLLTNLPSNEIIKAKDFATFLPSLGSDYSQFVAAASIGAFDAECDDLRQRISDLGFSPMDRSLLLWAVAWNRTAMRDNKDIDQTLCMKTTFAELALFDATKSIVARKPDPVPPVMLPATEAQMRLAIEANERLATFMLTPESLVNETMAEDLFAFPLEIEDRVQSSILLNPNIQLNNAAQWQTRRVNRDRAIASRVGCYLFLPNSSGGPSRMAFIALLNTDTGQRETLVELFFSSTPVPTDRALVNRMVLVNEAGATAELALMKTKFARGCGLSGWRPALLD